MVGSAAPLPAEALHARFRSGAVGVPLSPGMPALSLKPRRQLSQRLRHCTRRCTCEVSVNQRQGAALLVLQLKVPGQQPARHRRKLALVCGGRGGGAGVPKGAWEAGLHGRPAGQAGCLAGLAAAAAAVARKQQRQHFRSKLLISQHCLTNIEVVVAAPQVPPLLHLPHDSALPILHRGAGGQWAAGSGTQRPSSTRDPSPGST